MKQRTLLPDNTYSFTITQGYHNEKRTLGHLCFTIDTGQYVRRNIIEEYPTAENLTMALDRLCNELNYEYFGLPTDERFFEQFIGMRTLGNVVTVQQSNAWVNRIKSFELPKGQPQVNVLEQPTDEHYYPETKTKKKLPIL